MAKSAVRLVFAAMLALLVTQAPTPSVRVVAAFEIVWLAQSEVRQRAPRKIPRPARTSPDRREPQAYVSLEASAPDVVLIYQLPPPVSTFAS
jgi:hypothetical protein